MWKRHDFRFPLRTFRIRCLVFIFFSCFLHSHNWNWLVSFFFFTKRSKDDNVRVISSGVDTPKKKNTNNARKYNLKTLLSWPIKVRRSLCTRVKRTDFLARYATSCEQRYTKVKCSIIVLVYTHLERAEE